MANRNRRTKARRIKEVKEAQHKKTVAKPIYKRPWIWIALAALIIAIAVPSAIQYNDQVKKEQAAAAAEAKAEQEAEELIWESAQAPLSAIGVTESAITDKTFDVNLTESEDEFDTAQVTIVTEVRTILASFVYDTTGSSWVCTQITNEDGSHIYWSYFNEGVENATQTALVSPDGSVSTEPLYDYLTDGLVPGAVTGAAVETPDADAEQAGAATDAATGAATDAATDATTDAATDATTGAATGAAAS
jgi:hypothetical protein